MLHQKKNRLLLGVFSSLSLIMFWGLFRSIIPVFPEHSSSMIVGVLAYLALIFIVLTSEWKNQGVSTTAGMAGVLLIAIHLVFEMNMIAAIRFPALTNPFGYAALAAFLIALIMKELSMIDQWQTIRQYVHGVMTIGAGFVYWHVASIGIVTTTWTFFIPFTALLIWTLVHFGVVIIFQKKTAALQQTDS